MRPISTPVVLTRRRPARLTADGEFHTFSTAHGRHLFVADGSRIYDLQAEQAGLVEEWCEHATPLDGLVDDPLAVALGVAVDPRRRYVDDADPAVPALASLSLNVMQACNMSCGYCYADEGRFGGAARRMSVEVARQAVERLVAEARPGADLVLGFMGGEPLLNRAVVHDASRYASDVASDAGHGIRFAITTNLTLLRPEDAALFTELPFTLAVSIDGDRAANDRSRRMHDGSGSYDRVLDGLRVLAAHGRPRHMAARVTVTPRTGELLPLLDHLLALGFDEVGFAPVLVSPDPSLAFGEDEFSRFLAAMIACGEKALAETLAGRPYPFGNFETAVHEIHRGTHRPLPCGGGAAYLSVDADGDLFTCHRLVDDPAHAMGSVTGGLDEAGRAAHLARSHVDRMEPCRGCWARYLCGGGCYHEVSRRGRVACDYIRGWLDFCLRAYVELSARHPDHFGPTEHRR